MPSWATHPDETQQQTADAVGCSRKYGTEVINAVTIVGKTHVEVTPSNRCCYSYIPDVARLETFDLVRKYRHDKRVTADGGSLQE